MASAIGARHDGDDYQSRLFWLHACDLFEAENTHVVAVAYEEGRTRAFDDVVVYYDTEMLDEDGQPLVADHIQAKFHRWPTGAVTWEALKDPAFIGAERFSLLERLRDAYRQHAQTGGKRRFILDTPWVIASHDLLARMTSLADERIHLDSGARVPARARARLLEELLQHLGMDDVTELRAILRAFRLRQGFSLAEADRCLDARLRSVGLLPVEAGRQAHPYDDLTRRFVRGARAPLTRRDIERICTRERLWRGHTLSEAGAVRLGVRSFARHAEELAQETDELLDLVAHFDGRFPRDEATWDEAIFPAIERFVARCERSTRYHLHLHAHGSIAFAAGYCLDPKTGIDAVPVQRSTSGSAIWRPALRPDREVYPLFHVQERPIPATGSERPEHARTDVAMVIGATIDILSDVEAYVLARLPGVGRIIAFTPAHGAGPDAILDGTHAQLLARQIAQSCRTQRTPAERHGRIHLFSAAPNGLLYFLGQLSRGLGRLILYEFEFERNQLGAYHPALTFPPRSSFTLQQREPLNR